jgi:DNA-binding NarL/FixJ family response regulator
MRPSFVGRRRELEALGEVRQRAHADRRPAVVVITGEPGSGKTRLLSEALAAGGPGRVARGSGFEPTKSVPFAALGDFLRTLTSVPRHGAALEQLVFGGHGQAARDPLRAFEAAHRALTGFGMAILAVDDLQWVDEPSLGLIHYLVRAAEADQRPLLVLAAARPSSIAAALQASAETELPPERRAMIELGPLTLAEAIRLARSIDLDASDATVEGHWRRSRGVPFWLEALVKERSGADQSHLIAERLLSLGSDAGAALAGLAVAARPFGLEDIGAALGWPSDRVRQAVAELVAGGLAVETAGAVGVAHDLIREAAYQSLPAPARTRLHARLAKVIEADAGDDLQLLAEALEHSARGGLPTATLARDLLAAPARRLLGRHHLQLIASISDALPAGTAARLDLDRGLADLAGVLGEQQLAEERWTAVGVGTADPDERQHAELEAARAAYRLAHADAAHAHLARARAAALPSPEMDVELDALTADVQLWLDHETAAGAASAAQGLAKAEAIVAAAGGIEQLGSTMRTAYLAALEAAGDAALQENRGGDVVHLAEYTVLVASGLEPEQHIAALIRAGFGPRSLGRIAEAETRYREAWELARRVVSPSAMVEAGSGLARALRTLGRLVEAQAVASETALLEGRLGTAPRRWGNAPAALHSIELSLGDPDRALAALRHDAETDPDPHFRLGIHETIAVWLARFPGQRSVREVVRELAAADSDAAVARCPRCSSELAIVSAEILARIGEPAAARAKREAWEGPSGNRNLMEEVWRLRADAAIELSEGNAPKAIETLNQLITALTTAGFLEDLVWAYLDLGTALGSIDRGQSTEAFTRAAALSAEIGAESQGRLAAQALRRLGVRAWRRKASVGDTRSGSGGLGDLSPREREIAALVAGGMSNREIAESLLISPKTVERHVTNVLSKVGLRNRTELATRVGATVVRDSPDE